MQKTITNNANNRLKFNKMPTDKQVSASQGLNKSEISLIVGSDRLDPGAKSKKNKKNKNTTKSKTEASEGNIDMQTEGATGEAFDHNSEESILNVCDCSLSA